MFNRRHFIKLFSLAAAALVAEPSGMAVAEVSTFDPKQVYFKGCLIEHEEYYPLTYTKLEQAYESCMKGEEKPNLAGVIWKGRILD